MVLSTRVSLQWLPENPQELTNTMVFTSPKDHFVDVRVYKDAYPYQQTSESPEAFEKVFQWVLVGEEEPIEGTDKIRFKHTINLQEIMKSLATGRPLSECRSDPDIGEFSALENSQDRKEIGAMVRPETGKVTDYVEVWRSLDPNATSVEKEVREGSTENGTPTPIMTFDLKSKGFIGRIIRLGNWVQGVVYEEGEKACPISVMRSTRSVRNRESEEWSTLISYGKYKFPDIYKDGIANGAWERVE